MSGKSLKTCCIFKKGEQALNVVDEVLPDDEVAAPNANSSLVSNDTSISFNTTSIGYEMLARLFGVKLDDVSVGLHNVITELTETGKPVLQAYRNGYWVPGSEMNVTGHLEVSG